jgi:cytoskeletal protein RodZ
MDPQMQNQNPNTAPASPPTSEPSMPQMPSMPDMPKQAPAMPQMSSPKKGMSPIFWMLIVIALGVGAAAWWYITYQMPGVVPMNNEQPQVNTEAREDMKISNEIGETDMGDIDSEFESVDQDINGL